MAKILENASRSESLKTALSRLGAICLALIAMTFAVFGQTGRFPFINYDDNQYVYENTIVMRGLSLKGFIWALTFGGIGHWHPLTWVSHMADCQIFGLRPRGPHLVNVALQAVAAVFLFLALRRLTGNLWRSALVAAVFAIHPLRVESVAWISERKDVLSGVFFMLTLWAYARHAPQPSRMGRWAVAVCFGLGLMCKNTLVTLPLLLLLLDRWPLGRVNPIGALLREKIPLFLLSAASCVMTFLAPEKMLEVDRTPLAQRLGNAVISYAIYLRQMVWPAALAIPYPIPAHGHSAGTAAGACLLLTVISGIVFFARKNRPYLWVGWLWYLGMLVPAIGLIQISYYAHADRYTYLPGIGLVLAVTWLVADWSLRWKAREWILAGLASVILGGLMTGAVRQTGYWRSNETLWKHALDCTTGNYVARNNLGLAYYTAGEIEPAIAEYEKALEIKPDYALARNNLGLALSDEGKVDAAIAQYENALKIFPAYGAAHNNLGLILLEQGKTAPAIEHFLQATNFMPASPEPLVNLGNAFLRTNGVDNAIALYKHALQLSPEDVAAHTALGNGWMQKGNLEEAAGEYQDTLRIEPTNAPAHNNLGLVFLKRHQTPEAIAQFQRAIQLRPNYVDPHVNLGDALLQQGKVEEAIARYNGALALDSHNVRASYTLANLFVQKGSLDEAINLLERILQSTPDNAQAQNSLANALVQKGNLKKAVLHFEQACRLQPNDPGLQNNLAWLLAVSPDPSLRNGPRALELAQSANKLTGRKNPMMLRTLAAAFAAVNRFDDAAQTARQAMELARGARRDDLAAQLQSELQRYESAPR